MDGCLEGGMNRVGEVGEVGGGSKQRKKKTHRW